MVALAAVVVKETQGKPVAMETPHLQHLRKAIMAELVEVIPDRIPLVPEGVEAPVQLEALEAMLQMETAATAAMEPHLRFQDHRLLMLVAEVAVVITQLVALVVLAAVETGLEMTQQPQAEQPTQGVAVVVAVVCQAERLVDLEVRA
jgi:hypothetical protein